MEVLTVISSANMEKLQKEQSLDDTAIMALYDEKVRNCIASALKDSTSYDSLAIVGIAKIAGNKPVIEKCFGELPRLLPLASGDYILEMTINDDEVLTINADIFNELESRMQEVRIDSVDYGELVETLNSKLRLGGGEESDMDLLCFFPKLRLKDCSAFLVLTEDWEQGAKGRNRLKATKINNLKVFKREKVH